MKINKYIASLFLLLLLLGCEKDEEPSPLFSQVWLFEEFRGMGTTENANINAQHEGETLDFNTNGTLTITAKNGSTSKKSFEFDDTDADNVVNYGTLIYEKGKLSEETWRVSALSGTNFIITRYDAGLNRTLTWRYIPNN